MRGQQASIFESRGIPGQPLSFRSWPWALLREHTCGLHANNSCHELFPRTNKSNHVCRLRQSNWSYFSLIWGFFRSCVNCLKWPQATPASLVFLIFPSWAAILNRIPQSSGISCSLFCRSKDDIVTREWIGQSVGARLVRGSAWLTNRGTGG